MFSDEIPAPLSSNVMRKLFLPLAGVFNDVPGSLTSALILMVPPGCNASREFKKEIDKDRLQKIRIRLNSRKPVGGLNLDLDSSLVDFVVQKIPYVAQQQSEVDGTKDRFLSSRKLQELAHNAGDSVDLRTNDLQVFIELGLAARPSQQMLRASTDNVQWRADLMR